MRDLPFIVLAHAVPSRAFAVPGSVRRRDPEQPFVSAPMSIPVQIRRRFAVPRACVVVAALLAAACSDRRSPLAVFDPPPQPASAPALLASLDCTASVRAGTVKCGRGALPSKARGYIVVGGQGQYVQLTSTPGSYNAATAVLSFDVTVENLIPQPMNTADGATPHGEGVRVIFHAGPTRTTGTGDVSVLNHDSVDSFTGSSQKLFRYRGNLLGGDGILGQNETSAAKTWQLSVDPGVTTFTFQVYVVAQVPAPQGYVDVTPPADTLAEGGTAALTATVRNAVGVPVAGQTVTWGTTNAAVATVNASGQVSAVAPGSVTITATAGTRSGSATLQVCPSLDVGEVYLAAAGSFCLAGVTGQAKSEYTVMPANVGPSDQAFSLTGSGIVGVSGPPAPVRLPGLRRARAGGHLVSDDAFHLR
ncbi:MAG TPA: Ig-like domain-containing protein, partial [Longimicrobium sp.]|nr:Ig-like domain-containing protein [Longimicrobium sp.]